MTKEQRRLLATVLFLLLVGLAVKAYRTAQPEEMPAAAPHSEAGYAVPEL